MISGVELLEAFALSLLTLCYPFRNSLIMLEAVMEQEAACRAREQAQQLRQRELRAELDYSLSHLGVAKPATAAQSAAGAFTGQF